MKRIHFVDQAQDLISLDLKHIAGRFWEVIGGEIPYHASLWKGERVNGESLKVGKQVEILDFKRQCSTFIKYPIVSIEDIEEKEINVFTSKI